MEENQNQMVKTCQQITVTITGMFRDRENTEIAT